MGLLTELDLANVTVVVTEWMLWRDVCQFYKSVDRKKRKVGDTRQQNI